MAIIELKLFPILMCVCMISTDQKSIIYVKHDYDSVYFQCSMYVLRKCVLKYEVILRLE